MAAYHLAEVNVAKALAPVDDPLLADFVARLDAVNALADGSPGFVWRLMTESGNSTDVRAYEDPYILFNLSVWESPEALKAFVYRGGHLEVMRRRREWFERALEMSLAMWWIPAGEIPTVEEAKARLAHLREHGDSAHAFSFHRLFPPPDAPDPRPHEDLADPCPAP
jgi:heme-degrading monooxygenase HmoA